jgi:hypothetical protein
VWGETGEALPAAEQASLFRGSGTIGGHEVDGNRNAATVLKSKRPHVSGGGLGEVSFRKRHLPQAFSAAKLRLRSILYGSAAEDQVL